MKQRLAGLAGKERRQAVIDLVRRQVAAVLAHPTPDALEIHRGLLDLGFDSLTAVELRNRLNRVTGLRLPSTVLFDHPTINALSEHLDGQLGAGDSDPLLPVLAELDRLEGTLAALPADSRIELRLAALLGRLRPAQPADAGEEDLESVTDDELFSVLDDELGRS